MKEYITTIQELLTGRNEDFDKSNAIRIVRHADTRGNDERTIDGVPFDGTLMDLYRFDRPKFERYQGNQKKGAFDKIDYLVVCIGETGTRARFVGVYKVGPSTDDPANPGVLCDYVLEEVKDFAPLARRIVIDWGRATVSWLQDYKRLKKPVIRIDEGFEDANGVPRFITYSDVMLSFEELNAIFKNEDEEWKNVLKAMNCIYLIQDKNNGKQYIGSTYGTGGIWGRWKIYFETGGHGGNKGLEEIISNDPNYARHFQWCILETLSIRVSDREAIHREDMWKRKLMTREPFGYNQN